METQSSAPTPVAGWYPDPCARHDFRYFDGEAWTQHVSDAGKALVDTDPIVASAEAAAQDVQPVDTSGESLLLTLPDSFGTGSKASMVIYLTDRRLVVDPAMVSSPSSADIGFGFVSSFARFAIAEKRAEKRHREEPPVDAAQLDTLLVTVPGAFQIPYGDVAAVEMKRKSSECLAKITGNKIIGKRNATWTFRVKLQYVDQMAEVLSEAMPGKVTVK